MITFECSNEHGSMKFDHMMYTEMFCSSSYLFVCFPKHSIIMSNNIEILKCTVCGTEQTFCGRVKTSFGKLFYLVIFVFLWFSLNIVLKRINEVLMIESFKS